MAFDFTFLETIDSTSSEAMRKIEGGVTPPFVIAARSQTSGRGRRGKSWNSPKGGIYLSIALPIESFEALSTISLEAGVAVALWLEKKFAINPTLKWPNDIYFEAKKLGGILSESAVSGQSIKAVVIGVGINLVPFWEHEIPQTLENPRISLLEIVGEELLNPFEKDLEFSLKSLAGFFMEKLQERSHLLQSFSRFDTSQGLWLREGLKFRDMGIDASNGNLNLVSLSTDEKISLSSVNHDFAWWPISHEARPLFEKLVIADLGNSSLKMWKPEFGVMTELGRFESCEQLSNRSASLSLENKFVAIGVVGEKDLSSYSQVMEDLGATVWRIKKKPIRVNLQGYDLNLIGIDRLAFMEGYLKKKRLQSDSIKKTQVSLHTIPEFAGMIKPQSELIENRKSDICGAILVSAGTATTIDIIQSDGKYIGGLIMPGVQTSLIAMHASTSLLPLLNATDLFDDRCSEKEGGESQDSSQKRFNSVSSTRSFYWQNPRTTSDAMRAGVYAALNGTIALIKSELKILYPDSEFECLSSGGFATFIEESVIDHEMIPLGLYTMALG